MIGDLDGAVVCKLPVGKDDGEGAMRSAYNEGCADGVVCSEGCADGEGVIGLGVEICCSSFSCLSLAFLVLLRFNERRLLA